jgi:hypothetical protein
MNKVRKPSKKARFLSAVACVMLGLPSYAQVYLQDFTSIHTDPDKKQWVVQDAIYRDDNEKVYYIAQQLRPIGKEESFLGITMCDPDMNPIVTWEYFNEPYKMSIKTETIDEMPDQKALILVGHYSNRDNISEPFVMSVDKFSGNINWFKYFPGLELTSLDAEEDYVIVTGARKLPDGDGIYSYSASAALLMRLDKNGDLVWEREFEDDKYASSDYGPKYIYNILNDVKRIDEKYYFAVGNTNNWVYKEQPQNLWDADGLVVMVDADGNINYSLFLGNALPMDPNKQQPIQFELMDHVTFDPEDKTVVIAGERLDNPQAYVSDEYPTPDQWGLWVTKFDPYNVSTVWTNRYQYKDQYYRVSDPEIEHDTKAQYGISYNFDTYNTIAMKLRNDGSVLYHRYHFLSDMMEEKYLNDIVKAFEYNNMTIVGQVRPKDDPMSSYGWNVQAFDNILEYCEMKDYEVKPKEVKHDIEKVENREYKVKDKDEPLAQDKIKLENRVYCDKVLISAKSGSTGGDVMSNVSQDVATGNVNISVRKTGLAVAGNNQFTATLYNALGQKMLETPAFGSNYQVNVNELPAGIYFLHIAGGQFKQAHTVFVK